MLKLQTPNREHNKPIIRRPTKTGLTKLDGCCINSLNKILSNKPS